MSDNKPQWLGNGTELPLRTEIEYRYAAWPEESSWLKTQILFLGMGLMVILDSNGDELSIPFNAWPQMICRPVGGLIVSEYAELLEGVVAVVEATSYEKHVLWDKLHNGKGYTWEQSLSGPIVTIGYLDKRPVCISLFVHKINDRRILFIDATSGVVDWTMIDKWLEKNLPKTAFRDNGYLNKSDAQNIYNVVR